MEHQQLPTWVTWIQDNWFLSFLVIAEAYVLGTLMVTGWVPNIEDPSTWGWFHGIGVPVFFLAGATGGGLAVRTSMAAADAFSHRRWGFALMNLTGLLAISCIEIWSSLSERANNLTPGVADKAVLSLVGIGGATLSPTVVIVALFLPSITIWWGFSAQKPAEQQIESTEQLKRRLDNEALIRQHKRQQAIETAKARRQQINALMARDEEPEPVETPAPVEDALPAEPTNVPDEARPIVTIGVPRNLITARDLSAMMAEKYGVTMTTDAATALIKTVKGAHQVMDARGQPWAAPRSATLARARAQYRVGTSVVA
jgi:hypothetical protein